MARQTLQVSGGVAAVMVLAACAAGAAVVAPFSIQVVDEQTGRGVPLVELTTTGGIGLVTDSAGLVAFDEPGLMHQRVFFAVQSHGYEFPIDGFGQRGAALDIVPGGRATLKIKRLNLAERLYRVTGQGIYRDSVLLGHQAPLEQPLLNAQVIGCDSVVNAVYQGRLFWFWGDTNRPGYPLGNFHTTGATSELPGNGGLSPGVGVDLKYFTGDDGFARPMAQMAGDGPTWITALAVLPAAAGRQQMLCHYLKVKPPLTVYRRGIARWNETTERFEHVADWPAESLALPHGHVLLAGEGDARYAYFAAPSPLVRVAARAEAYCQASQYEAFTCLLPGSSAGAPRIDRDAAGRARYSWQRGAVPLWPSDQARLVNQSLLERTEAPHLLQDAAGKQVVPHSGSVCWNDYRGRFIAIFVEHFGTSPLGEVWYAESPTLAGPWSRAVKIVTHDQYSFYNPKQHPYFDEQGGRVIYFEGTYTHTFSGNDRPTPRYDYNQIMYRLDLSAVRLEAQSDAP